MENNPSDMQSQTATTRPTSAYVVVSARRLRQILKEIKNANRPGIPMAILRFEVSSSEQDSITESGLQIQLQLKDVDPV